MDLKSISSKFTLLVTLALFAFLAVNLVSIVSVFVRAATLSSWQLATLLIFSWLMWSLTSITYTVGGNRVAVFKVFPGKLFWQFASVACVIMVIFTWALSKERIQALEGYKDAGNRAGTIRTTVETFQFGIRKIDRDTPFFTDKNAQSFDVALKMGEEVYCTENPVTIKEVGEPLIRCMRKNDQGLFLNGRRGYIPLSLTSPISLEESSGTGTRNQRTTADYDRLLAENEQLKIQLRQLQSNLTSRITNLESQLAKRDRENGELRSQLVQAQQAQQVAQQAQRQAEQGWVFMQKKAEDWERLARTCWNTYGRP